MRFAIASEGKTDFTVLRNLLFGFFNDKRMPITRLRPKDREPFGWGNLFNYISSQDFRDDCEDENIDHVIVQIDTYECEEWQAGVKHIHDDREEVEAFVAQVKVVLIDKIGTAFYEAHQSKIIFAICVHEIECWLLPFNTDKLAHYSKVTACANAVEQIALKRGFSIHKKDYQEGKNYEDLSAGMKNNKDLMKKSQLNAGLKLFIESLSVAFPPPTA